MASLFLSTYENKVDKKGRISVPAPFRSVVSSQSFHGIVVYASFMHPCLEGCSMARLEQLSNSIDMMDPYSDTRDAFAASILGGSVQLPFDKDGRVVLPSYLIESAEISESAVFVGKGQTFEIWNPQKFAVYSKNAYELAQQKRNELRLSPLANNAGERGQK